MATDADGVAPINKQDDRLAIWHVVIDPSWPMGRHAGPRTVRVALSSAVRGSTVR
jgi:hypothetical protein